MSTAKTSYLYSTLPAVLNAGGIDWENDTLKVALLTSAYVPGTTEGAKFSDISTHEVAGGDGYTAGGAELDNAALDIDGAFTFLKADDVTWAELTKTFKWGVVYKVESDPGVSGDDYLILRIDLDAAPSGIDYTIRWSNLGLASFEIVNPA